MAFVKQMGPPDQHVIEIRVEHGKPVCVPYYALVHPGDTLCWRLVGGGPWSIHFLGKRSPVSGTVLDIAGHGDRTYEVHRVSRTKQGHYPYALAVLPDNREDPMGPPRIYLDANCPEIIIDRSGG